MKSDIEAIFDKLTQGDRTVLGQALTMVESDLPSDREKSIRLLELCGQKISATNDSIRFTVSGSPGAGKSTLIEVVGQKAIDEGHRVGVITVDPTSIISYGSILGDKSRMQRLSLSDSAYVRSSPAGSLLGGIGRRSFEMMTLLTAANYDIIFLETVGVGQSEHIAWHLTDGFILVIQPGSGDELQGIKRGITELADIIAVNKSDGALKEASILSKTYFQNAIQYFQPLRNNWEPKILTCSALEHKGIDELWEVLRSYSQARTENNNLSQERRRQNSYWLTWSLGITAQHLLMEHPLVNQKINEGFTNLEQERKSPFRTEFEIEETMRNLVSFQHKAL